MKKFRSNYDDDKYKLVRVGRLGLERSTGGSLTGTRPARNVINGMMMMMTMVMMMVMVMACRHIPTTTKSHHGGEFEAKTFCLAAFR